MPFFIKKTEKNDDEENNLTKEIINELKSEEQTNQETEKQIQIKQKNEQEQTPTGTITIKLLAENIKFATFLIASPNIYQDVASIIKDIISKIHNPQLKINSNCNCIWCKEKITNLQDFLTS